MRFEKDSDRLTLFFEGKINADTAGEVKTQAEELLANNKHASLYIDMSDVDYVSSAGLRVLLGIKKSEPLLYVVNVNSDVYEIMETTGFTTILNVKKKLRTISLDNAKLIGAGYFSKVYRLDEDTIVKVFCRGTQLSDVERECNLAKKAFMMGIPCAITFDIVKVDDMNGLVFESINQGTLSAEIAKNPEKLDSYIKEYAAFLKNINSTDAGTNCDLPDANSFAIEKIEKAKPYISPEDYIRSKSLLSGIKRTNTFVHSDCHTGNIMLQNDEYLLIDMDTLSVGNPIFELGAIYCTYIVFNEYIPNSNDEFLGLNEEITKRLFYDTLREYFKGLDESQLQENINRIKFVGYAHMLFWVLSYKSEDMKFFEFCYSRLKDCMAVINNANLEGI